MQGRCWTRMEEQRLVEMIRSGVRLGEAARLLNRTYRSVSQRVWALGGPVPREQNGERIRRMVLEGHATGMTDGQIAAKFGLSIECVWKRRQLMGLPSNAKAGRPRKEKRGHHLQV